VIQIGRNAPCPCGSGKKYKHCCIDKHLRDSRIESDIPLSGETPKHIKEIFGQLEPEGFATIEELREKMRGLTDNFNQSPLDDFLGLSPERMFRFQNTELFSEGSGLELNVKVNRKLIKNTLIAKIADHVLVAILESGGLKATTCKKNFPRKLSQEVGEILKANSSQFGKYLSYSSVQSEDDVRPLRLIRGTLTKCGFIKLRKGSFHLTKKGVETVENGLSATAYRKLLNDYLNFVNWGYYDRYPKLQELQEFVYFLLFIIHKKADDFIMAEEVGLAFLRAFPQTLRSCVEHFSGYCSPEELLCHTSEHRFITHISHLFGLLEIKKLDDRKDKWRKTILCKKTSLFRELFIWEV